MCTHIYIILQFQQPNNTRKITESRDSFSQFQILTIHLQLSIVYSYRKSVILDEMFPELDSGDGCRAFHILQCHFKQFKMARSHGCHMKINKYIIEYFQKKKIINTIQKFSGTVKFIPVKAKIIPLYFIFTCHWHIKIQCLYLSYFIYLFINL